MDASKFDNLVQQLSATPHRRSLLRSLAGGGVASVLALLGQGEVEAAFPRKCKKTVQCGPGAKCVKKHGKPTGKCKCLPGLTSCPGTLGCVNTQNDSNNCGPACNVCPTPPNAASVFCSSGGCGFTCNTGTVPCGSQCVTACRAPKQLDPSTCQCQCPPTTCTVGKEQNPNTCQCQCAGEFPIEFSNGTCATTCVPGTSLCADLCRGECLSTPLGDVCTSFPGLGFCTPNPDSDSCPIGQFCSSGEGRCNTAC